MDKYRKITEEEFKRLKYNDLVYIKVGDIFLKKIIYKSPELNEKKELVIKTFTPRTSYKQTEIYVSV